MSKIPKNIVGRVVALSCFSARYWVVVDEVSKHGIHGNFVLRSGTYDDGKSYRVKLKDSRREISNGRGLFPRPEKIRVLRREYL